MIWRSKNPLYNYPFETIRERIIFAWFPTRCHDGTTAWLSHMYERAELAGSGSYRYWWVRKLLPLATSWDVPARWRLDERPPETEYTIP